MLGQIVNCKARAVDRRGELVIVVGKLEMDLLDTADDLVRLAEKYSSNLPARPAALRSRASNKDVVLITGTTGGFGCDVLEHLLRDEQVERVYAFNRPGSQAMDRQLIRFRERDLDESLLSTSKFRMVEVVLHEPCFGLKPEQLDEVRACPIYVADDETEVRALDPTLSNSYHAQWYDARACFIRITLTFPLLAIAWKVNFNLSIASFEVDIQATRNLVDLALSSPYTQPPTLIFVSSIGTFASTCSVQG